MEFLNPFIWALFGTKEMGTEPLAPLFTNVNIYQKKKRQNRQKAFSMSFKRQ